MLLDPTVIAIKCCWMERKEARAKDHTASFSSSFSLETTHAVSVNTINYST